MAIHVIDVKFCCLGECKEVYDGMISNVCTLLHDHVHNSIIVVIWVK